MRLSLLCVYITAEAAQAEKSAPTTATTPPITGNAVPRHGNIQAKNEQKKRGDTPALKLRSNLKKVY